MNLQHINVKIYVEDDSAVDLSRFIDVFHSWIKQQLLDELLIDVADYRHVPAGPGVILIGHEADYAMDNKGGRLGLLYNRKAPLDGSNADRFGQALSSAAKACQMLENEFKDNGVLTFSRQEFQLFVNDRAIAPNTAETLQNCQDEIASFLTATIGHNQFNLEHHSNPRQRFGVEVKVTEAFELAAISSR